MRLLHAAVALTLLAGSVPASELSLPLVLTGSVEPAADGALPTGFSWRAWPEADASSVVASAPEGAVDVARAGGFYAAPAVDADLVAGTWIVAIEGDFSGTPYFAVSTSTQAGGPRLFPAAQLVAVPEPAVMLDGTTARLEWPSIAQPGVTGLRILRSVDGGLPEEVDRVASMETAWSDPGLAPGSYSYGLRVVFAGDVTSLGASGPSGAVVVAGADRDGDLVLDVADNCDMFANPGQADADGDGRGDACELVFGDVAPRGRPDGRVDIADVVRALRLTVGLDTAGEAELRAGNVAPASLVPGEPELATPTLAEPAAIDVADVVLLLRVVVGLTELTEPR